MPSAPASGTDPARAASDLGDPVGPEVLHDLIQGTRRLRPAAAPQGLDQPSRSSTITAWHRLQLSRQTKRDERGPSALV